MFVKHAFINKSAVLIIIILLNSTNLYSQFDTEFWFAAPEITVGHADRPIYLRITSAALPSDVVISQPANTSFAPITINLAANTSSTVDLTPWIDIIENKPPNTILNYGLKITATEPITAYYEASTTLDPEIFALKGKNSLGTEFYVPMQNFLNNGTSYNPTPYSSFDIIATENNTVVTITPTQDLVGHVANVPFTVVLQEGETYSAQSASQLATYRPAGSYVISNKKIAITMKDDSMDGSPYGGCADLGGDQIIPVNILGTKYIAVRGFLNAPYDKIFIVATQNNTSIMIDGVYATTLNAGANYKYDMGSANAVYIESSAPITVLQLSGFGCETGLSILPPIECTGSSSVTFTRSTSDAFYVTLLVQQGGENNFLLNGVAGIINGSSFGDVPSTNGQWKYAQLSFSTSEIPAGVASQINNTTHLFHLGLVHGTPTGGCRFGFFSDYASYKFQIQILTNSTHLCEGDTLILQSNAIQGATYDWSGPNNFTFQNQTVQIDSVTIAQSGYYFVNGTTGNCIITPDSVLIDIYENPVVTINPASASICSGSSITFSTNSSIPASTYLWSPIQDFDDPNISTPSATPVSDTTIYSLIITDIHGCKGMDTSIITLFDITSDFTLDTLVCLENTSTILYTGNASNSAFFYWDFNGGNVISGSGPGPVEVQWNSPGNYTVNLEVKESGCDISEPTSHNIEIIKINANITGKNPLCNGSADGSVIATVSEGQPPYNYLWTPGNSTASSINGLVAGNYNVIITDSNGCKDTASIVLTHPPALSIILTAKNEKCTGNCNGEIQANVSGGTPEYSYIWNTNPPQINQIAINLCTGIWKVTVTDSNNCSITDSATITTNTIINASAIANPDFGYTPLNVQFNYTGDEASNYLWDFGDGNTSTEMNPIHTYNNTGIYNVILTAISNYPDTCSDVYGMIIIVENPSSVVIPNIFTPNGDGYNDVFKAETTSIEYEKMIIFNRWGKKIYEWNNLGGNWNGENYADGTYYYIYYGKGYDGVEYNKQGTVTLLRGNK